LKKKKGRRLEGGISRNFFWSLWSGDGARTDSG
jgi:hypothetical protein